MRPYGSKSKWLNENLSPLYRFLRKAVGRNWNRVYSEICENLSPSNTVQQHVRDHVTDYVATCTTVKDGEILVASKRWNEPQRLRESFYEFYVHPVSGMLLLNRFYRNRRELKRLRQQAEAARVFARRRDIAPDTQLHQLKGVWYEVQLACRPHADKGQPYDVVRDAGLSPLPPTELYGCSCYYATAKRQLSKKELRDRGLRS